MNNEYPDYDIDFDIEKLFPDKVEGNEYYALIIDRDQFSPNRNPAAMDRIKDVCLKNAYFLVVTNPYFELWLALHTQDYDKYEMELFMRSYYELYSSGMKTTVKQRSSVGPVGYLKGHISGYDKNLSSFPYLNEKGLERAVDNLKKYYKINLDEVLKKITAEDFSPIGSNILDILNK